MKKNTLLKLAGALLVLTLITTTLVSGTYAKYVTTVTASGTATVAKWVATLDTKGTTNTTYTTTFDLFKTFSDTGVAGKLLAPGTTGSFDMAYDTAGSQVARNVKITLAADSSLASLTYLKFYSDAAKTTEITPAAGAVTLLDINYGPTDAGTGTVTVYWAWAFESDAAQDTADTLDGITPLVNAPLTAIFTATQLDVAP
ncbi:MAG TPA: hypothetical protein VLR89_00775 [Anaerolineaceae bacterium]|nr:hypothetical protein [Anaerolineaceae bacterium]